MIDKQRTPLRRPRPRSRLSRSEALLPLEQNTPIVAAQKVACRFVAEHWPEFANVQPSVRTRAHHVPDAALLARLGMDADEVVLRHAGEEYTFTFASEQPTEEGSRNPHIAAVTVDSDQRVIKTTVSR